MQFYQYLQKTGGLLMWPLVVASLLATTMILDRLFYWVHFYFLKNPGLREKLLHTPPDPEDQLTFGDPLAHVLWEYHRHGLERAKLLAQEKLDLSRRFLPTLKLIGALSTSVGLLGTVVGVSMSFQSMAKTNSSGVAQGLSTALYTTIGGLIIFLISSLFLHLFITLTDGLKKKLEFSIRKVQLPAEEDREPTDVASKVENYAVP